MASNEVRLQRGIQRGTAFEITINAEPFTACPGENLATVLLDGGQSPVSLAPFQPDRFSNNKAGSAEPADVKYPGSVMEPERN